MSGMIKRENWDDLQFNINDRRWALEDMKRHYSGLCLSLELDESIPEQDKAYALMQFQNWFRRQVDELTR